MVTCRCISLLPFVIYWFISSVKIITFPCDILDDRHVFLIFLKFEKGVVFVEGDMCIQFDCHVRFNLGGNSRLWINEQIHV